MTQRLHLLMTIIKQFVLKGNGVVGLRVQVGVKCGGCGDGYGTKGRGCVFIVFILTHTCAHSLTTYVVYKLFVIKRAQLRHRTNHCIKWVSN